MEEKKKPSNLGIYVIIGIIVLSLFSLFDSVPSFGDSDDTAKFDAKRDGVGVVELKGAIMDSAKFLKDLAQLEKNPRVKTLVVRIDSPGGAVAPSQEIFDELLSTGKKMPVVASFGNIAASGGYYVGIGADTIFASPGTLTGSIGVITQFTNLKEISEFLKLKMVTFKSGKYKDAGNPFREMKKEESDLFQNMIDDVYDQFLGHVSERSKIPVEELKKFADGRVMTGRQAKKAGLVDEMGGLNKALAFARKKASLPIDAPVIEPKLDERDLLVNFLEKSLETASKSFWLEFKNAMTQQLQDLSTTIR